MFQRVGVESRRARHLRISSSRLPRVKRAARQRTEGEPLELPSAPLLPTLPNDARIRLAGGRTGTRPYGRPP